MTPLIKTLLKRNLIPSNSILTGKVRANTLGGINLKVKKRVNYSCLSMQGFVCQDELGKKYLMEFDDLESIDGMGLTRFARTHNIKADGTDAKVGKKRGRKPKSQINKNNGGLLDNGENQRTNSAHQIESTA